VLMADGWCHGRRYAWLLSLCRLWVLIASIAGIIVAVAAADLFMRVLVPPLLSPFPRLRLVA
jgi:hypothetical protein